jgi:tRNA dimethylallyltransferase
MNETISKNKIPLLVIVGPTASGKTALSIFLAQKLDGEIVSADSRQVYKGLDIGTGKVTAEEMSNIPHHLIDVADPHIQYTAADFKRDAEKAISDIHARGKLPIIVGGTGHYIDALVDNLSLPNVPPDELLRKELSTKTADELFALLKEKDPARAATIDPKNPRRLIRALEIADARGAVPPLSKNESLYSPIFIGLNPPDEILKKKIWDRLISRLDTGMVLEVKNLHEKEGLSWERLDELGLEYRFIAKFLKGELSEEKMKEGLYTAICQYAKRQMTWFRRNKRIVWVTSSQEALEVAKKERL